MHFNHNFPAAVDVVPNRYDLTPAEEKALHPQNLLDLLFAIGLTIKNHPETFSNQTNDETAEWITSQLAAVGVVVSPMGASYSHLKKGHQICFQKN